MTTEKGIYIQVINRIFLLMLGIVVFCVPSDVSCAEEVSGLVVSASREWDEVTKEYIHAPQKEVTVVCSVFDVTLLHFCYREYDENGVLKEHVLQAENLIVTKDGEPVESDVDFEDSDQISCRGMITFLFKEPGDYCISSSLEGQEGSFVTIHVSEPTRGFFTEPYCSNRNRHYFFPYNDNNVIYYILPEDEQLNDNGNINSGYPITVSARIEGNYYEITGEEVSEFLTYELLEGFTNVYKLTLNTDVLENGYNNYAISMYTISRDDSAEWNFDILNVGDGLSDKIGLIITKDTPQSELTEYADWGLTKSSDYYLLTANNFHYYLAYYDYDENYNLIEIRPDIEDIRITKNNIDMTNDVAICMDSDGRYEIQFEETGIYKLIVSMEDGREDAVHIYVENCEAGFYEALPPTKPISYTYYLNEKNNIVYYVVPESEKLDGKNVFSVLVNNESLLAERQPEYFTYELVEGSNNIYKITLQTNNEEVKQWELHAYSEYARKSSTLFVKRNIMSGLTVSTYWWGEESEGTLGHDVQREVTATCSVFEITSLGFCYHEVDEDGNLQEYRLNAEELTITRDGEPAGDYVDVANYPDDLRNVRFRFKQPGDYIVSSSVEGQDDSVVTIHVPEPSTGFFTEPECSNKNRTYFYPYDDKNVIYYILPENTRLIEMDSFLDGNPLYIQINTAEGLQNVPYDETQQYVSYELLEENSRVCKLTFNVDKLDTVDYCYLHVYYESTDGSFGEIRNDYLCVGSSEDDRIGLSVVWGARDSAFDGTIENIMKKEMTTYMNASGVDSYDFIFYDYNEKGELVEIIPELENIKIMKQGVDVTEDVSLWQNSYGSYEISFQESGKYRVVVTLDDGREDVVDIYVENHLYGFYSTPVVDVYELTKFELKKRNRVVYYILSDYMKLNENADVNAGMPFAISVNGSKVSQELQAEYFSYELVEGTQNVYKITFQTDKTKEELSNFNFYVYYEDTATAESQMDYLFVTNEIPAKELTTEEPTTEEPTTEELTTEEPKVEEPTTEEPTMEEPATEEPTTEEPTTEEPTTEEPTTEESTTETSPVEGTVGKQESVFQLSDVVINSIDTQTYHAKAIEPEVLVTYQGNQLIQGRDYTIEYKNNISVGTADILLTGIGDYSGTKEMHFQIEPYKVDGLSEILKGKDGEIYRAVYTKKKITLKTAFRLSYMIGGERQYLEPKEGRDYTSKYYNNNKIGMARIVYTFKGNYTGSVVKKFLIVPPTTKITKVKKSGNSLVISWKKISSCDRYEIYRATSKKGKYKKIATIKGKSKISYKDKKAKKGKKYYYKVKACKKVSGTLYKSGWSNVKTGKR